MLMSSLPNDLLEELRTKRVGLVLAGGGFKGAYQIGVWRALYKLGIRKFHSVAGTSVGALNALLIAKDDYESAKLIWREASIMRWSPRGVCRLISAYGLLLGPFLVSFIAQLCAWIIATAKYAPNWKELFFCALGVIDQVYWPVHFFMLLGAIFSAAAMVIAVGLTFVEDIFSRKVFVSSPDQQLLLFLSSLLGYSLFMAHSWLSALGLPLGILCFTVGLALLTKAKMNSRVLSNTDLLRRLRVLIDINAIRANTRSLFVTTARSRVAVTNPFKLNIAPAYNAMVVRDDPESKPCWVPEYHNVCALQSADEVHRLLRYTSALPYLFRTVDPAAEEWVADGGLADNTPILPVLMSGVDYVIVVQLDPNQTTAYRSRDSLKRSIQEQYLRYWAPTLRDEEVTSLYREYLRRRKKIGSIYDLSLKEPDVSDLMPGLPDSDCVGFVVITPEYPLPTINVPVLSFLTGTLNFRLSARRKWLIRGFRETWRGLRAADGENPRGIMTLPAIQVLHKEC